MKLYGYCQGYFGRDSHETKVIEAIGPDWVVVRETDGRPNFASFDDKEEMVECLERWRKYNVVVEGRE